MTNPRSNQRPCETPAASLPHAAPLPAIHCSPTSDGQTETAPPPLPPLHPPRHPPASLRRRTAGRCPLSSATASSTPVWAMERRRSRHWSIAGSPWLGRVDPPQRPWPGPLLPTDADEAEVPAQQPTRAADTADSALTAAKRRRRHEALRCQRCAGTVRPLRHRRLSGPGRQQLDCTQCTVHSVLHSVGGVDRACTQRHQGDDVSSHGAPVQVLWPVGLSLGGRSDRPPEPCLTSGSSLAHLAL